MTSLSGMDDAEQSHLDETPMDRPIPKRKGRRWVKVAAAAGLTAIAVLTAVYLLPRAGSRVIAKDEVIISQARSQPFQEYLTLRAEAVAARTAIVGAVAGGQVDRVVAENGAMVAEGDVLATLTNPQLELEVTTRAAEIVGRLGDTAGQELILEQDRGARSRELAEARYALLLASRELDIQKRLHDRSIVSDAALRAAQDGATYAENRVRSLEEAARREQAVSARRAAANQQTAQRLRTSLDQIEGSLRALVLTAPVSGRLTNFDLRPGQTLSVGDTVGEIDSDGDYKLSAEIDEFYLGRIAEGQPATAQISGRTIEMTVSKVIPQVRDGRFQIELAFGDERALRLRRGQSIDVRLNFGAAQRALVVPSGPWLEAGGGGYIFVVGPDGRGATRRPITIGRRNPTQIEVTSGLRAGERVLTSSYDAIGDSSMVMFK